MSDAETDFYSYRLAAMNEKNPVVASEDIYNQQGALLLRKGSEFSQSRADLIAKHKLVKPLEHSVDIANSLDAKSLYELLIRFAATLPGLNAVTDNETVHTALRGQCEFYEQFPLLRQKLTVFASQLPEIYNNSLYSAMAGIVLAHELRMPEQEQQAVFIGGLMHNTGFLHLDPALTSNASELERDESLNVQAHPIIAKHFLDQVPNLPAMIGDAVADHHERTDGTGYPKQKFGVDLSLTSQVLALTDMIVSAHKRCAQHGEHAQQLILVVLQLNNSVHFEEVYKAAAKLIRLGPAPSSPPSHTPSTSDMIDQLERILKTFDASKKLAFVLMNNAKIRLTKSVASMLGRLATSIVSAGIIQDEYRAWLEDLAKHDDPNEHLALLKSQIMQDEIEEQLERLKSIMWKTIKKIPAENVSLLQSAMKSYQQIELLKNK